MCVSMCGKGRLSICICERIWEKGPYRTKTKLKIRVNTPVRVNPVKNVFFVV